MLGRLVVVRHERELALPGSPLLRGLLGALLVADAPLGADRLADLVWGSARADDVRPGSVHVAVSRLRRWFASAGADDVLVLTHDAAGYRLSGAAGRTDLARFREWVGRSVAVPDPAERLDLLLRAGKLCRGPLLSGLGRLERQDRLVRAVEAEVRDGLLALADAALVAGQPGRAVEVLARAAADDALDERLHARLVTVLAAAGRNADAVRHYERQRRVLAAELGVEPGAELHRAHQAARRERRGADLSLDRRVHRPADRLAARLVRPGLLPLGVTDFTGRDDEVGLLTQVLAGVAGRRPGRGRRVATISGRGGLGKTALALEVAHRLRFAFPDGQLYDRLHGAHDRPAEPVEVLGRLLGALGVAARGLPAGVDERAALFRDLVAERRVLVVLDDAAGEAQVRPLLPVGPGCAVLVTSRRRLPVLGVAAVELDVFDTETAVALLARIVGPARVAADAAAARELVALCGHVPLAVRIAGSRLARLPHRTPAWLVARLADERGRLDELVIDDLAVRPGLESSYRALGTGAARLLRRLALLGAPDVPSGVAAELLGVPLAEAEDRLDELVHAFLVDPAGVDGAGQPRYRLHDHVRVLARERCLTDEPGR